MYELCGKIIVSNSNELKLCKRYIICLILCAIFRVIQCKSTRSNMTAVKYGKIYLKMLIFCMVSYGIMNKYFEKLNNICKNIHLYIKFRYASI